MADRLKAQHITFFNRLPQPGPSQESSTKSKIGEQFDEKGNIKSLTVFLITIGDEIELDKLLENQKEQKKSQKVQQKNKKGGIVASITRKIHDKVIDIRIKDMRYLIKDMKAVCKQIVDYEVKIPQCIKGVLLIINKSSIHKKISQELQNFLIIWKQQQKNKEHPLNIVISIPVLQFTTVNLYSFLQLGKKYKESIIEISCCTNLEEMVSKLYILKCSQYGIAEQHKNFIKNLKYDIQRLKSRKFKLQSSIVHKIDKNWKQKINDIIKIINSLLQAFDAILESGQKDQYLLLCDQYMTLTRHIQQINTIISFLNHRLHQQDNFSQQNMQSSIIQNNTPIKPIQQTKNKLQVLKLVRQKLPKQQQKIFEKMHNMKESNLQSSQKIDKQLNELDKKIKDLIQTSKKYLNISEPDTNNSMQQQQNDYLANNQLEQEEVLYKKKLDYKMEFQIKSMKNFDQKLKFIYTQLNKMSCLSNPNSFSLVQKQPIPILISSYLHEKLKQIKKDGKNKKQEGTKQSISEENKQSIQSVRILIKQTQNILETYDVDKIQDINYNMKYLQWKLQIDQYFMTVLQANWQVLKIK